MWPFKRRLKTAKMMKKGLMCQQLVELLTDYLEGALPEQEHRDVEAHLAECEHCTEYLVQFKATIAATGRLRVEDVSAEAMDDLLDVFRNWRSSEPQP
jgi:anti-sigma factor RsiW